MSHIYIYILQKRAKAQTYTYIVYIIMQIIPKYIYCGWGSLTNEMFRRKSVLVTIIMVNKIFTNMCNGKKKLQQ